MHTSSTAIIDYATQLSNGAKMPRTSWRDLAAFPIVVPPLSLLQAFDHVVHPMFERIYANIEVRRTLSDIRDALLPRVVSGKTPSPEEIEAIEEEVA
jgi:type I restriction enzyme S subunit